MQDSAGDEGAVFAGVVSKGLESKDTRNDQRQLVNGVVESAELSQDIATGSGGSANIYVNNAYYDSGSQNLRIEFSGDSLNSYSGGSYDIYNRFQITDNYGYPISGAITGGYFDGSNAYVLNLYDGALSSYGGQNLEVRYSDYSGGVAIWGVLETYSGADAQISHKLYTKDRMVPWFSQHICYYTNLILALKLRLSSVETH